MFGELTVERESKFGISLDERVGCGVVLNLGHSATMTAAIAGARRFIKVLWLKRRTDEDEHALEWADSLVLVACQAQCSKVNGSVRDA